MGLYYFEAEKEKEYEAKLLVKGNHVQAYIDDVLYCDHICKKAVPELLYYSAVKENKWTVIVKTVNVEAKEKELFMTFSENESEKWSKVHIFAMEGFLPDDRNSLDSPCKVVPKEKIEVINGNGYQYILPGNSFTVFRFEK